MMIAFIFANSISKIVCFYLKMMVYPTETFLWTGTIIKSVACLFVTLCIQIYNYVNIFRLLQTIDWCTFHGAKSRSRLAHSGNSMLKSFPNFSSVWKQYTCQTYQYCISKTRSYYKLYECHPILCCWKKL